MKDNKDNEVDLSQFNKCAFYLENKVIKVKDIYARLEMKNKDFS